MAKGEKKVAKLASRTIHDQGTRVYTCSADGNRMAWVQYFGTNGRGRTALRCEKCGVIKFRSEL